jgi:uncharacterized membrane protein HdeD (DUF308 family)
MSQERRNLWAWIFFVGTKVSLIAALICLFVAPLVCAWVLLTLAGVLLVVSFSLAWINFRVQAKEEWKGELS